MSRLGGLTLSAELSDGQDILQSLLSYRSAAGCSCVRVNAPQRSFPFPGQPKTRSPQC